MSELSEGEYEYMYALCNEAGSEDMPPESLDEPAGKWRVRGGAVLEISKMSDEHLKNAISLFRRLGCGGHMKIQELRDELARRTR